jgi:putative membrane protein insertion efficiency factor
MSRLTLVRSLALPALFLAGFVAAGCLFGSIRPAFGSPQTMKGPLRSASIPIADQAQESSPVRMAMLDAIHFYRSIISPTQGARCGFYPSCSAFGLHAVQHYGPLQGIMMTADRLTRCNLFKGPGPDYPLRPDGRLYDPVTANLLLER